MERTTLTEKQKPAKQVTGSTRNVSTVGMKSTTNALCLENLMTIATSARAKQEQIVGCGFVMTIKALRTRMNQMNIGGMINLTHRKNLG
jgi:hypothetical protein